MTRLERLKDIASKLEHQLKTDDSLRISQRTDLETKYNGVLEDILEELNLGNK